MVLEKSQKKCSMNLIRTLNQYEVPYPENFWSRFTRFGVQKKTISTLRKSLFSYQTDKPISFVLNVLQVGHLRTLFFNQVWCDRRKTRIFH